MILNKNLNWKGQTLFAGTLIDEEFRKVLAEEEPTTGECLGTLLEWNGKCMTRQDQLDNPRDLIINKEYYETVLGGAQ